MLNMSKKLGKKGKKPADNPELILITQDLSNIYNTAREKSIKLLYSNRKYYLLCRVVK